MGFLRGLEGLGRVARALGIGALGIGHWGEAFARPSALGAPSSRRDGPPNQRPQGEGVLSQSFTGSLPGPRSPVPQIPELEPSSGRRVRTQRTRESEIEAQGGRDDVPSASAHRPRSKDSPPRGGSQACQLRLRCGSLRSPTAGSGSIHATMGSHGLRRGSTRDTRPPPPGVLQGAPRYVRRAPRGEQSPDARRMWRARDSHGAR